MSAAWDEVLTLPSGIFYALKKGSTAMTEDQERQIRGLRMRGAGYKAIASATGLSRDIVRNYCKSHSLEGLASEFTMNIKEQIEKGLACAGCGRPLEQPRTGRRRRFCSDQCRRHWWAAHPEQSTHSAEATYHGTCAYCGQPFQSYRNQTRKYCSHECYIRDRFCRPEDGVPRLRQEETT